MYPIEKERSYALRILSSPVFCGGDAATVAASEKENHLGQALVPGGCGRPHYCIGRRSGAYPAEKHAGIFIQMEMNLLALRSSIIFLLETTAM